MNYTVTQMSNALSVELTDLSSMEARDSQSLQPLILGDDIVVLYITKVQPPDNGRGSITIPLHPKVAPIIVKASNFASFVEKFIETLPVDKTQAKSS